MQQQRTFKKTGRLKACTFLLFWLNGCTMVSTHDHDLGYAYDRSNACVPASHDQQCSCSESNYPDSEFLAGYTIEGECEYGPGWFLRWPAFLSRWYAEKELPAPPYPRFHPLPTRPMLAPHSESAPTQPTVWGGDL